MANDMENVCTRVYGWFPMAKGVSNLYRYAEISVAANGHYLDALSVENDPRSAGESPGQLTSPVRRSGRVCGGFNPLKEEEVKIFKAVMNGDNIAFGFQNRDIRKQLFEPAESKKHALRLSAGTSRLLKKMQMHGLIAKIPRSRRWRATQKGWQTMGAAVEIFEQRWHHFFEKQAA